MTLKVFFIMFVYWIDDITRNLQSTSATSQGALGYIQKG